MRSANTSNQNHYIMKITTLKEAEAWFEKNPRRGVTVEHNGNAVNCTSLDQAKQVLGEKAKEPGKK